MITDKSSYLVRSPWGRALGGFEFLAALRRATTIKRIKESNVRAIAREARLLVAIAAAMRNGVLRRAAGDRFQLVDEAATELEGAADRLTAAIGTLE